VIDEEALGRASAVEAALGHDAVDVLVLNAGMQFGDVKHFTEDGFETVFAVNHLAHFLLLRLLMPRFGHGATVVVTTSNLHDPRTNKVAPPAHADAGRLARGQVELGEVQSARAPLRAYATSKLCNVLTARLLASSAFARERELKVIAFNPGLTPGTGLTRHQSLFFRIPFKVVVSVLSIMQRMNTVEGGGALLSDLALGRLCVPPGRIYASQVKRRLTWPDPSELASDNAVMEKLWRDSAAMVGVA
jgi:NAD(P)-dependent dehydrogenase (short-subunit alcohol dehydrogenase family)